MVEIVMKTITMYEHTCKRCEKTWKSMSQTPLCCGKCKTPYWNRPPKQKAA